MAPQWAEVSGVSSLMIRRARSSRSRWPCIRPAIRARLVLSQSRSWLALVVSRRFATIRLTLSSSSVTSPRAATMIDWVRSPSATALATPAIARTRVVRLLASSLTLSVRRFQVPDTPSTSAWPPSLPSVPTSAGHPGHLGRERRQLVDHRVDGRLQLQDLAAGVDVDLLAQVSRGDGGCHLGDVAHLAGQVASHEVDVVGEVLPHPRHPADLRLAAQPALAADPRGPPGSPRRRTPTAGRPSCSRSA